MRRVYVIRFAFVFRCRVQYNAIVIVFQREANASSVERHNIRWEWKQMKANESNLIDDAIRSEAHREGIAYNCSSDYFPLCLPLESNGFPLLRWASNIIMPWINEITFLSFRQILVRFCIFNESHALIISSALRHSTMEWFAINTCIQFSDVYLMYIYDQDLNIRWSIRWIKASHVIR